MAAYNAARSTAELGAAGAGGVLVGLVGPCAALVVAALGPIVAAAAGLAALQRRARSASRARRGWSRGGLSRSAPSRAA